MKFIRKNFEKINKKTYVNPENMHVTDRKGTLIGILEQTVIIVGNEVFKKK